MVRLGAWKSASDTPAKQPVVTYPLKMEQVRRKNEQAKDLLGLTGNGGRMRGSQGEAGGPGAR